MNRIVTKNLYFGYVKDVGIIKNICLEFEKNSINVILGLNGSGKTTLIKLLAGILHSVSGDIYLNDKSIFEYSFLERSKFISYVGQGIKNGDDYLVKDYLSFGLMNTLKFYRSPDAESVRKVEQAALKFGIENFLNKRMNELSGGERQIVSICRAYIQDTNIIILDEPTSALDFKNQSLVLNILREVVSTGKTIIMSTHNPNHALYLNSNVVLMDKGIVVESGPAERIICKDVLSGVYGDQLAYSKDLTYNEISIR